MCAAAMTAPSERGRLPPTASISPLPRFAKYTFSPGRMPAKSPAISRKPAFSASAAASRTASRSVRASLRKRIYPRQYSSIVTISSVPTVS